eukprot:TRINITY_DN11660_c0_g1_i1.p1 TRINITY_DN11660_c0_g1~~TRINITY_DN11660_c0_g1_i1.p1  ORF type:complete len:1321 (-),score=187.02 TRINITY_DN11660_c0_g1_i1:181-4143(-)
MRQCNLRAFCFVVSVLFWIFACVPIRAQDQLQDVLEKLGRFASQKEGVEGDALSAAADILGSLKAQREERAKRQEARNEERNKRREQADQREAGDKQNRGSSEQDRKKADNDDTTTTSTSFPDARSAGTDDSHTRKTHEDPFEDIVKDFQAGAGSLRADRDKKRQELKDAESQLSEAKQLVRDLERKLAEARSKASRLEDEVKAKRLAKREAEQAVLRAYTDIAASVENTAKRAMDASSHSTAAQSEFSRIEPSPSAEVILWGDRHLQGDSHRLRCCDYHDLSALRKPLSIRSITLPEGVRAVLYPKVRFSSDTEADSSGIEIFGSVNEMDGLIGFTLSCCRAIHLLSGVRHSIESSVILYEEEGFKGSSEAFLPGDYERKQPAVVASIRVPAGLQVTLYAAPRFGDGSFMASMKHDSSTFPAQETSPTQDKQPRLPVVSLKVRRIRDDDLHGLFVYPDAEFEGRPQFFESGQHYIYPETWPDIASAKPTNQTFGRFFTTTGLITVREATSGTQLARPHAIEVSAICEPQDYCGEHGKCVAPQRCECSGSFQGTRCHLQTPDESSAVLCERNVVVRGETLQCALLPRRYNLGCNATSLFVRVKACGDAEGFATLMGSPIVVAERHLAGPPQERSSFAFDVSFNATGTFAKPFEIQVFNREQKGAFVPQLRVLERCDLPGTSARVQCKSQGSQDSCQLSLLRNGKPITCPRHALRVFWAKRGIARDEIVLRESEAASDKFELDVTAAPASIRDGASKRKLRMIVEVRHGPTWEPATFRAEVDVRMPIDVVKQTLAVAKEKLRHGAVANALELLETCAYFPSCAALQVTLLARLGRVDDADHAFAELQVALGSKDSSAKIIAAVRETISSARVALASIADSGQDEATLRLRLASAVQAVPFDAHVRLQSSAAALRAADFEAAASDARHALRLGKIPCNVSTRSCNDVSRGAALAALGNALLALGHGDAARINFFSCVQLEDVASDASGAARSATTCRNAAEDALALGREITAIDTLIDSESWTHAWSAAERFTLKHGNRLVQFHATAWGLRAASARCIAGHALNHTDSSAEALNACNTVVKAPAYMRERLDAARLLRCHVALAELLERQASLHEALVAAEAAESMLGDSPPLDDLAAIVRLLRARLYRSAREHEEESAAGKGENASKEKPKPPANFYDVLGVARNATTSEIKQAYRRLALTYHPDKNKDPEAVQIFLDVQKAYQVLSDETLRRRYDAGQEGVADDAGTKNMKPMKFRVVERDRERGIAKVWWYDPNTGEEGFMEMEIDKDEGERSSASIARQLYEHCCLPSPLDTADQQEGT